MLKGFHISHVIRTSAQLNPVTTFTTIAATEADVDSMKYLEASGVARGVISVQEMHRRLSKI
jgi:carbamoyl-phosphate synthase large subunit